VVWCQDSLSVWCVGRCLLSGVCFTRTHNHNHNPALCSHTYSHLQGCNGRPNHHPTKCTACDTANYV
jgi:hypothetical protein